jgi:hypothetical protein
VAKGLRLQKGDNAPNIVAKLISFMEKSHEEKKIQYELAKDFEEENHEKEKIFNEKFMEAIKELKAKPKVKKPQPRDEKGRFKKQTDDETKKVVEGVKSEVGVAKTAAKSEVGVATRVVGTAASEGASVAGTATRVVAGAVRTAAPYVAGAAAVAGVSAAAAFTIRGETGATADKAIQKVGQIVPNDPKPGVTSYGIVGINSGGSVQSFVKDNPQFELTAKPASKEFDEQWKKASLERPQEMLAAQLKWYENHVEVPLRKDMQKIIPKEFAGDDRVAVYLTDRRNQYGKLMEKQAISYASDASSATDFIKRMTEFDKSHINEAFRTYLSNHPNNAPGLLKRITDRQNYALGLTVSPTPIDDSKSNKLNDTSITNKDLKKSEAPTVIVNNSVNSTNVMTNKQTVVVKPKTTDIKPLQMETQ